MTVEWRGGRPAAISTAAAAAAGFGANSNSNDWQKRRSQDYQKGACKPVRSAPSVHRPFSHTTTSGFKEDSFKNELRVERLGSSPESTHAAPVPSRHAFLGDAASRQMAGEGLGDDYNHTDPASPSEQRHKSGPDRTSTDEDSKAPGRVLSAPVDSPSPKMPVKPFPSLVGLNLTRAPTAKPRVASDRLAQPFASTCGFGGCQGHKSHVTALSHCAERV